MSEEVHVIEVENNYKGKVSMVKTILEDIKKKKMKHYNQFSKYKKLNIFTKSFINGLNSISVCSLVVAFNEIYNSIMIIALISTSISSITSAITSSIDIENKVHSHNTSNLQYNDLYRDIAARLLRNGMSSQDLDNLLSEINSRMGLIEDHSEPITIKL